MRVYSAPAPTSSGGEVNLEQIYQVTESLQDHLHWQLNLTPFSDRDREIAEAFIDAIDNSGMISHSLEEIVAHIEYEDPEEALQDDELIAVFIAYNSLTRRVFLVAISKSACLFSSTN